MPEKIFEIKIAELIVGDVLASDVYNANGGILVKKDTEVTEHIANGLRKNFNNSIYVYRNIKESEEKISIDIYDILKKECEEVIDSVIKKFLKKSSKINEIRKIILQLLDDKKVLEYIIMLRAVGNPLFKHSIGVAIYSVAVGQELHFPTNRLLILGTSAILHDIGMTKIKRDIINKDDILSEEEKKTINNHPKYGFDLINEKGHYNIEVSNIILQHHEKYDGTGYPSGIANEKIHVMSKIIGLCDIFEALTNDRPYRKKYKRLESIEYLLGTGDYYFNHDIIQALIDSIVIYPFGQWIELNNGEVGVVVEEEKKKEFNIRPKVIIYFDKNNSKLNVPKYIDLSRRENNKILIERII